MHIAIAFTELRKQASINRATIATNLTKSKLITLGFDTASDLHHAIHKLKLQGLEAKEYGQDSIEQTKTYKCMFTYEGDVQITVTAD